jgi:hypothetical protein
MSRGTRCPQPATEPSAVPYVEYRGKRFGQTQTATVTVSDRASHPTYRRLNLIWRACSTLGRLAGALLHSRVGSLNAKAGRATSGLTVSTSKTIGKRKAAIRPQNKQTTEMIMPMTTCGASGSRCISLWETQPKLAYRNIGPAQDRRGRARPTQPRRLSAANTRAESSEKVRSTHCMQLGERTREGYAGVSRQRSDERKVVKLTGHGCVVPGRQSGRPGWRKCAVPRR